MKDCRSKIHIFAPFALAVFSGGASDSEFFCEYFNRFDLDPKEYETHVWEHHFLTSDNQEAGEPESGRWG